MSITQDDFRSALSRFACGVTIVTTKDASGNLHGLTVSAFASVSLDPPLILICIEKAAGSYHAFHESGLFAVHILSAGQSELSERFASQITKKFEGVDMNPNLDGLPLIAGCVANLECRVRNVCDGGDHSIFIAEVQDIAFHDGDPLVYFRSDYRELGERK
ncbi:MAG: flavin reductase family protein [Pyrinomonadaceae bacterium]